MAARSGDGGGESPASPSEGTAGGPWAELVAGASVIDHQALARLDFPALLLDLPCGRIRAANQGAADLFEVPVAVMLGRLNTDVLGLDDPESVKRAMAALATGDLDGYRARRHVTTPSGTGKVVHVWCRAVELDGVRSAVYIVSSPGDAWERTRRAPPPLWLEPLVVGSVDGDWRVERISIDVCDLLGWERDTLIGRPIVGDVHPDDVGALLRATAEDAESMVMFRHRLRHHDGSWVPIKGILLRLDGGRRARHAFAMLPDHGDGSEAPAADRIAELEARLRRIAAELQAAGVIDEIDRLPAATDHPQLTDLSSRQWEILIRLLRGERVPTIAKALYLSQSTVRNHLAAIFRRFGVHSQADLLALLRRP
jgi:DNA-binding CsgD family transcriptional regulator